MIALLLAKKIAELFCYLLAGFVMVRLHVLRDEDAAPLSKISLYLITPCTVINAFQIDATPWVLRGFLCAFVTAACLQALFTALTGVYGRMTRASVVDRAMIIWPNVGNLVIPLVAAIFGGEWVVFVSAYIVVFHLTVWTGGIRMFSGEKTLHLKKILLNPNIIACVAGALMMLFHIRLTGIPQTFIRTGAAFIGPMTMFITGMVMGSIRFREIFQNRHLYGTILMRMVVCPLAALLLIKAAVHLFGLSDLDTVFLLVLLSASAPGANMINQFAILYHQDAKYASVISVTTTLLSIITMPVMVYLYGIL